LNNPKQIKTKTVSNGGFFYGMPVRTVGLSTVSFAALHATKGCRLDPSCRHVVSSDNYL